MEPPFDGLEGVISTTSGYAGGHKANPTYKQVSSGSTGHTEAVLIQFDPAKISYTELLEVDWASVDPTPATWPPGRTTGARCPGVWSGFPSTRTGGTRSRALAMAYPSPIRSFLATKRSPEATAPPGSQRSPLWTRKGVSTRSTSG